MKNIMSHKRRNDPRAFSIAPFLFCILFFSGLLLHMAPKQTFSDAYAYYTYSSTEQSTEHSHMCRRRRCRHRHTLNSHRSHPYDVCAELRARRMASSTVVHRPNQERRMRLFSAIIAPVEPNNCGRRASSSLPLHLDAHRSFLIHFFFVLFLYFSFFLLLLCPCDLYS